MISERFSINTRKDKAEYAYNKSDYFGLIFICGSLFIIVDRLFDVQWMGYGFTDLLVDLIVMIIPGYILYRNVDRSFNSTIIQISENHVSIFESPIPTKLKRKFKISELKEVYLEEKKGYTDEGEYNRYNLVFRLMDNSQIIAYKNLSNLNEAKQIKSILDRDFLRHLFSS